MRELFKGYFPFSEEEIKEMWDECIFVFDTNVLLNMYRYKEKTRKEFINLLRKIESRVWIPYHVACKFVKNRDTTINSLLVNYDEYIKELKSICSKIENISEKNIKNENDCSLFLNNILKNIRMNIVKINNKKKNHEKILDNDEIMMFVDGMFKDKIGCILSDEDMKKYEKEGENRYANKIPPGYEDNNKDSNKYGGFFIWKEINEKSKDENKHIIFITEDKKEDWIRRVNGKTIGPRAELITEFYHNSGKLFYIYSTESFLHNSNRYMQSKISEDSIENVKDVQKVDTDVEKTLVGVDNFDNYNDEVRNRIIRRKIWHPSRFEDISRELQVIEDRILNRERTIRSIENRIGNNEDSNMPEYLEYREHLIDNLMFLKERRQLLLLKMRRMSDMD